MKIVLSADYFYPSQMGGPSNSIYWLAKALNQAGHDVTVVATAQAISLAVPFNHWLTLDCGRVMYTQNPHFYLPLTHIWYGWQAMKKADIVHVNSFFYPASIVWIFLSRMLGKPVLWAPHGELSPVVLTVRSGLKRFILQTVKRINPKVWFQAASTREADSIRQYFGPDVVILEIRNRIELPVLRVHAPVGQPYLLFIGRLHPVKAIDRLLAAVGASRLFREGAYRLLIAGPETDKNYVESLQQFVTAQGLSAKVLFIGFVQGEEKQQLYANAYLTILPSYTESFGNVVIESLAQGTPVVASTNTPWQVLETERVGAWVANDPDSLRQAIEHFLIMSSEEYLTYRKRAVDLAHREFSIADSVHEWEQIYEQLLQSNK
ncbi:glycosyltransferase family 4 protein [Spirosoma gilvum]